MCQVGCPTSNSSSSDSWVARGTSAASSREFMALLPLREAGPLLLSNHTGNKWISHRTLYLEFQKSCLFIKGARKGVIF